MNRLVIVGNGFDLAHGLPTSYRDFINYYWSTLKSRFQEKPFVDTTYVNPEFYRFLSINPISRFEDLKENLKEYCQEYGYFFDEKNLIARDKKTAGFKEIFKFKNHFFKLLNLKLKINNWVDIENEYYLELKKISKRNDIDSKTKQEKVENLNKEFDVIKNLLSEYLLQEVEKEDWYNYEPNDYFSLLEFFKIQYLDLKNNPNPRILNEFRKIDYEHLIEKDEQLKQFFNDEGEELIAEKIGWSYPTTLFLNFNYTGTVGLYNGKITNPKTGYAKIIHIHGALPKYDWNREPGICFGFGDEMDEDYSFIENLNNNEFLENFKSFFYFQGLSYKSLMDYIDSEKYQVFIMGHSCGLSDRTLLNTVFEHENCRSIKIFYHQRDDGSDNYNEITQNISRHFNDKKLMREILVNKSLSIPFPQNIRINKTRNYNENNSSEE